MFLFCAYKRGLSCLCLELNSDQNKFPFCNQSIYISSVSCHMLNIANNKYDSVSFNMCGKDTSC